MSDEHAEHQGGHELEAINAGLLFKIIGGLAIVVLLACAVVIQWFYQQARALEYDGATPHYLQKYWGEMDEEKAGLSDLAKDIANDPAQLASDPPPAGWVHPDDLKDGK